MASNTPPTTRHYVGLFRRLFSLVYDCFLLIAILFITTAIVNALNAGEAIEPGDPLYPMFVAMIVGIIYGYFAWFWMHGGQTLGMKTWRIKLVSADDAAPGWTAVNLRLITALLSLACVGMGFLWSLVDRKRRCWHDIASGTLLLDLRKLP